MVGCVGKEPVQPSASNPEVTKPESTKGEPKAEAKKDNAFIGKWSEFGKTVQGNPETWEFHKNGTVDIIDEVTGEKGPRMKINFKYEIIGNDTVTIKSIIGDFTAKISKTGDELTSVHGKYRRLK